MNKIRKTLYPFIIIFLFTSLTGCAKVSFSGRTEMNRIEFIRAVGVDMATDKPDYVRLTIATQKIETGQGGSQRKKSDILFSEGCTTFAAVRNFWSYMEKRPFWGHVKYLLIGEEAAKDGLSQYLDFFSRDPELRLNLEVYIIKGMTAEEFFKKSNQEEKFIFERLDGLNENQWGQSTYNVVQLMEAMYILDEKFLSLYLPSVYLGQVSENKMNENTPSDIIIEGFAFFNGDKLAGFLDKHLGRGVNWLRNKVKSGVINVKSPQGHQVSLEIIDTDSKMEPKIENGALTINVKVKMSTNIDGIKSNENIFKGDIIKYLEDEQEQFVKDEIESAIKLAQEKKLDFFGAGAAVLHKYPIVWEDFYEKNWGEAFSKVKFNVEVQSKINRTYDIDRPNASDESGYK